MNFVRKSFLHFRRCGRTVIAIGAVASVLIPGVAQAVTNNAPTFAGTNGHYMVAFGDPIGTRIGSVLATDIDAGNSISYTLLTGTGIAVDTSTGSITTTSTLSSFDMGIRTFSVRASDGTDSSTATFTLHIINPTKRVNGAKLDIWNGIGGVKVSDLTSALTFKQNRPNTSQTLTQLELPRLSINSTYFGSRGSALLIPPVSGNYRFFVAGDEATELRIRPLANRDPMGAGAADASNTYSVMPYDWWQNPTQASQQKYLVAGQVYSLEILHKQDFFSNYFAVAWSGPNMPSPVTGSSAMLIPSRSLFTPETIDTAAPSMPPRFVGHPAVGGGIKMTWSPSADNSQVSRYDIARDGTKIASVLATASELTYTDSATTTGIHDYTATAIDDSGNQSTAALIDNYNFSTPPTLDYALTTGDASALSSDTELIDAALTEIDSIRNTRANLLQALYGGLSSVEYSTNQFNNEFRIQPTASNRIFSIVDPNGTGTNPASQTACTSTSCNRTFGVAGTTSAGTRISMFSLTPFPNNGVENSGGSSWKIDLGAGLDRLLAWLISGNATTTPLASWKIAFIGKSADYTTISAYLNQRNISSTPNITQCSLANVSTCVLGKDLVIAGSGLVRSGADAVPDATTVDNALGSALTAGIPVMYAREKEGDSNLQTAFAARVNLDTYGWTQTWWGRADYKTSATVSDYIASAQVEVANAPIAKVLNHLKAGDWSIDLTACVATDCKTNATATTYITNEFWAGARDYMKSSLNALDAKGTRIFDGPINDNKLLKLLVLLGDVYRRDVKYPLRTSALEREAWFRGYFADHAQFNARSFNPKSLDLGTFSKQLDPSLPTYTRTLTPETHTSGTYVTATGLYAMPGQTFTVERLDSGTGTVQVFANFLRSASTWEFGSYNRPKYIQQPWLVVAPGRKYEITTTYGGPIYFNVGQTATIENLSFTFENVGEHPYWNGADTTTKFTQQMEAAKYDWVDFVTPGYEVHSRYTYMLDALQEARWPNPEKLGDVTAKYFYQSIYNLAGFTGQGLSISSSLQNLCNGLGWTSANSMSCTQAAFKIGDKTHFNSDQATCGFGCSGNPYDAWWHYSVLGWGDAHEVGHNVGSFGLYGGVSTEVTPNVFPSHAIYLWNKQNPDKYQYSTHDVEQEDIYKVLNYVQHAANPVTTLENSLWTGTWNEADMGSPEGNTGLYRLMVTMQLVQQSRARTDMTFGDGGWDVYTMMRHWERLKYQATSSSVAFAANSARLGLTSYSLAETQNLIDRDTWLLAASWVTQRDQRPLLDLYGITYTAKASAQVAAWGFAAVPKEMWYWPTQVSGKAFWTADAIGSMPVDGRVTNLPRQPLNFVYTTSNADGIHSELDNYIPTTFSISKPITLYATLGAAGRTTFKANGVAIPGCNSVATTNRTLKEWNSDQTGNLESKCDWIPSSLGNVTITTDFAPTDTSLVASTSQPLAIAIVDPGNAPSISGISTTAPFAGSRINVAGARLSDVNRITFNGMPIGFTLDSSTALHFLMPTVNAGNETGVFKIQTSTGYVVFTPSVTYRRLATSVALDRPKVISARGQVSQLQAIFTPVNTSDTSVRWTSSDSSIATVNQSGAVTAVATGNATITVRTVDGAFSATSTVTVVSGAVKPVLALRTNISSVDLAVNATQQISLTYFPSDATITDVSYTTTDSAVATVSTTGLITAKSVGTVTIRAISDESGASANVMVNVKLPVTGNDSTNTVSGIDTTMEFSARGGRAGTFTAYTGSNLPVLTGNVDLFIRRIGTTSPVTRLAFTDGYTDTGAKYIASSAVTYLSDMSCVTCTAWNNAIGNDVAASGGPLELYHTAPANRYVTMPRGVGVRSPSTLTYNLGGKYIRFKATAVADRAEYTMVHFTVKGDGVTLFGPTAALSRGSVPAMIDIDVTGVQTLSLIVEDDTQYQHGTADWGGAHLVAAVNSVSLNAPIRSVITGGTTSFSATVDAAAGVSTAVQWTSSNTSVATVDSAGNVTSLAPGTATITAAASASNTVTASATVLVEDPAIRSIALNKYATSIAVGSSETITSTVIKDIGATAPTWSSSNTSVVTVNQSGVITAVAAGTAIISLSNSSGSVIASVAVTAASSVVLPASVSTNKSSTSLAVGASETLTATVLPMDANNKSVSWSTSNARIATVSSTGVVTALAAGSATISVRTIDGNQTAAVAITVTQSATSVSGVTLNKSTFSLQMGATDSLVQAISPAGATNTAVRWTTSNALVATVSPSGVVTALAAGKATITVITADGAFTSTAVVTVTRPFNAVTAISLNVSVLTLAVSATSQLTATFAPGNATTPTLVWSTSDVSVATVSRSGLITAVHVGTVVITARTADGSVTSTVSVTVQ